MKIDYSIIVPIIRNGHLRGCFHIGVIRINRINIILNSLSYRYSFCYTMSPAGTINRSLLRSSIPYHYPRFSYKQAVPTGLRLSNGGHSPLQTGRSYEAQYHIIILDILTNRTSPRDYTYRMEAIPHYKQVAPTEFNTIPLSSIFLQTGRSNRTLVCPIPWRHHSRSPGEGPVYPDDRKPHLREGMWLLLIFSESVYLFRRLGALHY